MKRINFILYLIILPIIINGASYGRNDEEKTFIIRNKTTKEVYTVSNKNDTVPPEGYEVIELPLKLTAKDFPIEPTLYYYDNGEFEPNIQKIEKINSERRKWDTHVNDFIIAKESARSKLKKLGFSKAEIDAIFREGDYLDHPDEHGNAEILIPSYVDIIDIRKLEKLKVGR